MQQQIYPGTNDGPHRWMGSVAVDELGDLALGYSAANSTTNPDIRYAGRLAGDPIGTLPLTETTMPRSFMIDPAPAGHAAHQVA